MSFAFIEHYEIPRQGVREGLACCRNLKGPFHLVFHRYLPGLQQSHTIRFLSDC